ncbi:RHS repeat-associated core domain-containing protein [Pseudomonas sp. WC1]|uniref:RHS repeat-associated core domain-containing protein n=1 Tax=Pseudomonas sp. WC1 TaxID=3424772 RepID=UPI003D32E959
MTLEPNSFRTMGLLATDRQHSIVQHTSKAGRQAFAYTSYGFDAVGNRVQPWLGFDGYPRTPPLSCYFLGRGHRIYNPRLMRFISADSLSPFDAGGANAYAYCAGDPMNYRDDSGQSRNLTSQLHRHAQLENPLQYHPDWQNYPTLSKKAKRHIGKLISRIEKAKKLADQVENLPNARPTTSMPWVQFERNKKKIAKSFEKLEEGRFYSAVEYVQRGLPLPDWGTEADQNPLDSPRRPVAEAVDLPPEYDAPPPYSETMDMLRTAT